MKRFLNKNFNGTRKISDFSLKERIETAEIENYLQNCEPCQNISNESLRLKKMLKRAVESEVAPQRLIDSIKSQIRR